MCAFFDESAIRCFFSEMSSSAGSTPEKSACSLMASGIGANRSETEETPIASSILARSASVFGI